ncbi:MAG TPA: immunoglobulin domain-containing protein [Verrucomicrobiae bacterium]|nr:immunoglobulin domain-containing protein [Verrucomicrobiae bacterium]
MKHFLRLSWWALAVVLVRVSVNAQTTVALPGRSIVRLLPDYTRPLVYALNSGKATAGIGSLLALNSSNGVIEHELTLERMPSDMDIAPGGQFLYAIQFDNDTIAKIDLTSFLAVETRTLPPPDKYSTDLHYHIRAASPNLLYYVGAGWAPEVHRYDFDSGTELGRWTLEEGFGAGDIVLTRDGQTLYGWNQYGWSAGNVNSWVTRVDLRDGAFTYTGSTFRSWRRDPLDTPIFLDASESRVFNKQQAFATTNLATVLAEYAENLYGVSLHGEIVVGDRTIFNAVSGAALTSLPFSARVMGFSGDQKRLFLYQSDPSQVYLMDLSSLGFLSGPNLIPTPADGATIALPLASLRWSSSPVALGYRVYFGTNQAQVAAAGPASPLNLGTVQSSEIPAPPGLVSASRYFWRVDELRFGSNVSTGAVWRFETAPIKATPGVLNISSITGYSPASVTIQLDSDRGPQPWNLTEQIPWLVPDKINGTTPSSITFSFQTASLATGIYTDTVSIGSGSSTVSVPVRLEVFPLDIIKMETDYRRPYIYALQRAAGPGRPASVLFLNTTTEEIERVLPILSDPRDLTVHRAEDRLYIADFLTGALKVIDLESQEVLPSLAVYEGLDRVNPGPAGRVIMEDWNQWVGIFFIDTTVTTNGILPQAGFFREGDGESSADGEYYYHCDNNISNAGVTKYGISGDSLIGLGGGSTSHPFGSRHLVLSPDGTRLFWRGYMYDTDLSGPDHNIMAELAYMGSEVWAVSSNAWFAFCDSTAVDTRNVGVIHDLGFSSSVKALSGDQKKLFQFDPATKQLSVIPFQSIVVPKITQQPTPQTAVAGTTVSFTGVAMGATPLTYQWLFNGAPLAGANNLNLTFANVQPVQAGTYALRIRNPYGEVVSAAVTLEVLVPPTITQQPASLTVRADSNAVFTVSANGTQPLTYQWMHDGQPIAGGTSTLILTNVSLNNAGEYRVLVGNSVSSLLSAPANLTVVSAPVILQQPLSISARAGTNVTFETMFAGTPVIQFQWQKDGNPVSGATNASLTLLNVQPTAAGRYQVAARNNYGDVTSAVATLTVLLPPLITQGPTNQTVSAGSDVRFEVTATGSTPLEVRWQFEGRDIPGATNTFLVLTKVQAAVAGAYRAIVSNPVGTVTSSSAILRVTPAAPRFVQVPDSITVPAGDRAVIHASVVGSEPLAIQWFFQNSPSSDANAHALPLVIDNAQAVHQGNYHCVVSNNYGAATSPVVSLQIQARAPVITAQPSSRTVLAGTNVTLSVAAAGSEPLTYQWRQAGVDLPAASDITLALINVQAAHAGNYDVVAMNALGRATSSVATLTVNTPARVTLEPADRFVVLDDTVFLQANVAGSPPLSISWQFNGVTIPNAATSILTLDTVSLQQDGVYRINVTNPFGQASASSVLTVFPHGGTPIAYGDNSAGQTDVPTDLHDVVRVAAGNYHSLALRVNGAVVGWGDNSFGQAVAPEGLSAVKQIAAGDRFSVALRVNGAVIAWGDNSNQQTNVPPSATNIVAIAAGRAHVVALRSRGTVLAWGDNSQNQSQMPQLNEGKAIAAGEVHSLVLLSNGQVFGWGNNAYGQTTPPDGLRNAIAISAGYLHSLALRADGTVVAWGDNSFGQCNVPPNLSNVTVIAAGALHSVALRADGSLVGWGDDAFGQLSAPAWATNLLSVGAGYYHTVAILSAPFLSYQLTDDGLILRWEGPSVLQGSPTPLAGYQDIIGNSPFTIRWTPQTPAGFFRLKRLP